MSKQKGLAYFGFNVSEPKIKKTTDELREQQHENMMIPPGRVENSSLTRKKIMFSLTVKRHLTVQGSHKKSENRIPWLICFFPWLPFSWFQIWSWLCCTTCTTITNYIQSCHSHENKQFDDFSMTFWDIFIFQHFSMTAIFFQDFPWPWEPWQCYGLPVLYLWPFQ